MRATKRERLAELLRKEGYRVEASDLRPAEGYWRTDHRADVYRWEGTVARPDGLAISVYSWDTMTACVRRGIEIIQDRLSIDVYARDR